MRRLGQRLPSKQSKLGRFVVVIWEPRNFVENLQKPRVNVPFYECINQSFSIANSIVAKTYVTAVATEVANRET